MPEKPPFKISEYRVAARYGSGVTSPFTFALVADLHSSPPDAALERIARRRVDFIAVAGDLINFYERDGDAVPPLLRAMREVAPVFYVTGNHDLPRSAADEEAIRATGVVYFDNSGGIFDIAGSRVVMGGLSTIYDETWLDEFAGADGFKLLLCHHPEYYPALIRGRDIDLTVSGHAHGGQWRFFGRGVYSPGQGLFPKYTSGMYEGRLIVSRGLANNACVPRINNPLELAFVTVIPAPEK